MESSFRFGRVKGIPIGAHWSWFLVFVLILWSLTSTIFPTSYPGQSGTTYLAMGAVGAVCLFGSIVLHELGHTFRALREGRRIRSITLWLFGGVAEMETPFLSPGCELRVAIAGPAVSGLLGATFLLTGTALDAIGAPVAARGVATYVGVLNVMLAIFNLVPAVPLDGGRVLHSWLWHRQRDRLAATLSAMRAGRVLASVLIVVGLFDSLSSDVLGGLWIAFMGWFLLQAAEAEAADTVLRAAIEDVQVRQLMAEAPTTFSTDMTVAEAAALEHRHHHVVYPVVRGRHLVGMLPASRLAAVPAGHRRVLTVGDLMLARSAVPLVHPDQPVEDVLGELGHEPGRAVVVEDGEPVGMLAPSDVLRAMAPVRAGAEAAARRGRSQFVGMLFAVGAVVLVAGYLYHPPYLVLAPGPAFDVRGDITITGTATQEPTGPYLATSVRVGQPNLFGLLVAAVRTDREVVRASELLPSDISPSHYDTWQRQLYVDSEQLAAAAAARANGYTATVTGDGATVIGTVASSPASRVLRVDDTIVAVDGQRVSLADDLHDVVAAHPAGTTFTLTVVRSRQTLSVEVRSTELPRVAGGTGLGVIAGTANLRVTLPFQISFRARPDIGGPSAGTAYALAIADMLDTTDDARSRAVAATGTITVDGTVGQIGGIAEKAAAARGAGASVFVVPAAEEGGARHAGLTVLAVDTLEQALGALRSG